MSGGARLRALSRAVLGLRAHTGAGGRHGGVSRALSPVPAPVGAQAPGAGAPAIGASAGTPPDGPGRAHPARFRAWAELLRVSALFSVPGDALAGAAAAGLRPNRGTALATGTSLCLYEAGMALNDWSDREEDARERPGRPLPSGRITPRAALGAAVAFTGAGLGLAALAGRSAFGTATALAGTVWAYDLGLKHTRAAPATMATARGLDLLLGAAATRPFPRLAGAGPRTLAARASPARPAIIASRARGAEAVPPRPERGGHGESLAAAALLGVHTLAVTTVSRHETTGGSSRPPLAALATVAAIAGATAWPRRGGPPKTAAQATAAVYAGLASRPLVHAALNPSPPLLQRAVGGGIRAMIPLQATLAARAGAPRTAAALLTLLPVARHLSRKVSPT